MYLPCYRFQVIVMLLSAEVDPNIVNMSGLQAVDLLPKGETKSMERLRMAMYNGESYWYNVFYVFC